MLIKSADDKSRRVALLESLLQAPLLDARQQDWARRELQNLRRGVQGERDAAHYLDNHFADAPNHAVIHDLRLEFEGEVAQIDHLIIARGFTFYLLETKNFSGNLHINGFGEFSVSYGAGKTFGIASPLEQSRRHANVLAKVLERLKISGRLNSRPDFRHVVLIHPQGTIHRPPADQYDTTNVIKADQFATWREKYVEKGMSTLNVLGAALNLRSADTVREWAEKLVRQHRRPDLLSLPAFMQPPSAGPASQPILQAGVLAPAVGGTVQNQGACGDQEAAGSEKRRCICATCGSKITFAEAKFCWGQPKRFGGFQYCREHQAALK